MAKKVTEQEKRKMWKLHQEGNNYTQIAKKLHRSPDTVSRHVHEYEAAVRATTVIIDSIKT